VEAPPENPTDEITRLQRCIDDLVGICALPAVGVGADPSQVAGTLLDMLLNVLDLDLTFVRLRDPAGRPPIELVRVAPSREPAPGPEEIDEMFDRQLGDDPRKWPPRMQKSVGGEDIFLVPLPLGLRGELGVIVAACRRADFPRRTERLLLTVAANHAAIGLQEAWRTTEQKSAANERDRRVAQRAAELLAADEELRLRVGLLQHIPVAAWTIGPDGVPDFVNQSWLEYAGQTFDFVLSRSDGWMTALHPEDRDRASRIFWDGIHSGEGFTFEARLRRAQDGAYRWHLNRAVALRDAEGKALQFVGTSTDIEDLKRSEENAKRAETKLRESEHNLRQMTETIPGMLWGATANGMIDYCNARLLDYAGVPADEIMGDGWTKLLHPDDVDQTVRLWMSSVATGGPYRAEIRIFHAADRAYRWCVTTALPLLDPQGRILKWHGTIVDMHDWKQAQEDLRNTQAELAHMTRVTAMAELTASIAHEVNQPLSGIITNAGTCLRMLAAKPPNVDGASETARRMIRDGHRASDVITRLRTLFSKQEAVAESVDLNEAAREVIALSLSDLQRNRVILRSEFSDGLPSVTGDRVQLQQVILNLLRNASEAMSAVDDRPRELLVRTALDEAGHVRLSIQDAGVGVEPQAVSKLFQAFHSMKGHGMGIGLAVSRSIVESHQGRLWATPNEGPGATFSFSIPRKPEDAADSPMLHATGIPATTRARRKR
jgi:PAS domain S-box-containing protein